ncbi:transposable element Tc1 transposase [Elysia marginata]|uniref:Transposable element Tc1 transposase n=1 Tax=Elysia marginata TaxID=1093978 RepID=A0AAV4JTP1_9GAST|nr:transposable element Tc1 transposase [Elysia marginata]
MQRLSEVDRHRALGLLQAGLPICEVSLRMNVNRTTIFRLRQRLHETDTVSDRPRSGRPRCTKQRQDKNLVRNHMNNTFLSASASSRQTKGRNNQCISANTVRRRLSTSGLRARRPYIGPILTQRHRHQRTLWAQEHAAWDRIQWRSVVFSAHLDSALVMLMAIQHTHTLDTLRKEQLEVYHVMCRVQKEKRRVQREEHEQLRENIRRLFHRQRKRHLLRRVIAKFKENVQRKRAQREDLDAQGESVGSDQEGHYTDVVQTSVARFKRNLSVSVTKNETANTLTNTSGQSDRVHGESKATKEAREQENSSSAAEIQISTRNGGKKKDRILEPTTLSANRNGAKKKPDQHQKFLESTELKLASRDNVQAEVSSSLSPVVTLETTRGKKVLPCIGRTPTITTYACKVKSSSVDRDPNNPLITQTDAISNVARVNTPKKPTSVTDIGNESLETEAEHSTISDRCSSRPMRAILSAEHYHIHGSKSLKIPMPCNEYVDSTSTACIGAKERSIEVSETEFPDNSSIAFEDKENTGNGRKPNLVKKLKKEKEKRMQERTEILDSETIVRYGRKPYQDVVPMYGQPKRFEFLPPSRKLHHEQKKLVRAEHQIELEQQVKIDKFFAELFRPKDDDRYKFVKKDDEAEKPKRATLSLAGVLSGVFSVQLTDAPRGKQSLQDKFRRLQSCQYLRVYQPRRNNSAAEVDKVTSWDAAEKSLRTGFGAFAMKR